MNLFEIRLFHVVWGFSKGIHDNYEIWWKCLSKTCGYIYMNFGGYGGGTYMVHRTFLFIIQKNRKSTRAWPILKSNSTFWFKIFFLGWIIKILWKGGALGAPLLFIYEVSIVVLIDFKAVLLSPGIFLIQIVNTNMYLIHFHSKNIIKMRFPIFKKVFKPLQAFIIHCNVVK